MPREMNLIELIARPAAAQVFEDIEVERAAYGDDLGDQILHAFLQIFIHTVVYSALSSNPDGLSKQELFEHVAERLVDQKEVIASAVAAGFSEAAQNFYGKPFDYECVIAPTPSTAEIH